MTRTDTTLSKSFTLGGHWWLPNHPEKKVYGTLSYRPDAAPELSLEGAFKDTQLYIPDLYSNIVIHGMTSLGVFCTLMDAHQKSYQPNIPGTTTSEFFCNCVFIGNELINPRKDVFESSIVEFSSLSSWLMRDPFRIKKYPKKNSNATDLVIAYNNPNLISINLNCIQASIKFHATIPVSHENYKIGMRFTEDVIFRPKIKKSINWYLDIISNFRIFLSFLVGNPVNPISIRLCKKMRRNKNIGNKYYREYMNLCIPHLRSYEEKKLYPFDILIPYPFIKSNFDRLLNNWYQKAEIVKSAYNLLFGVTVQKDVPSEFLFLALIQAFESFHRSTSEGKYISDKLYTPIKAALINSIPESVSSSHRDALKSRIRYGNEYSLRKRFNLALNSMPASLREKATKNDSNFINKVVATRNFLTHREESGRANVLDTLNIIGASESLKIIITSLILNYIGINFEVFEKAISNNWRIKRILKF